MTFEERLSQARKAQAMTQQDVADALHVTRQTVSNWENGKNSPDIDTVIRLSDLYHLSLDHLLKGIESPAPRMPPVVTPQSSLYRLVGVIAGLLIIILGLELWWPLVTWPGFDFVLLGLTVLVIGLTWRLMRCLKQVSAHDRSASDK